jgi:hypothetical protein
MNITFERRVSRLERARSRQLEHDEDYEVTLGRLTKMAFTAHRLAIENGSADAAVKAVAQLSRMHGFDVSKRINDRDPIEDLTAPERDAVRKMVEAALEHARAADTLRKAS